MWTWQGEGGFAKCPYYYISLISKIVPKGGGGSNVQKSVSMHRSDAFYICMRLRYCNFYVINSAIHIRHIVAIHKSEFEICIEFAS